MSSSKYYAQFIAEQQVQLRKAGLVPQNIQEEGGVYKRPVHTFDVHDKKTGEHRGSFEVSNKNDKSEISKKLSFYGGDKSHAEHVSTSNISYHVNHDKEAKELKSRIKAHEHDAKHNADTYKNAAEDHKNAVEAHDAHVHASKANTEEATKKAMHAHFKYWNKQPFSHVEGGSDKNEKKFNKKVSDSRVMSGE